MVNMFKLCLSVVSFLYVCGLANGRTVKKAVPTFHSSEIVGHVTSNHITEASGLAASRKHPGYLYTHNDHGGSAAIYVISATSGHLAATLSIQGVTANDWEDVALGPCRPGSSEYCVYIGDTGNGGGSANNNIYRFPEPATLQDQTITVMDADKVSFSWNQEDCETLMVDPDCNVYLVSKVDLGKTDSYIAKVPSAAWGTSTRLTIPATRTINIRSHRKDPVGGDISPNGEEVLLKSKENVFYWNANGSRDYIELLTHPPQGDLPYTMQTRGETVCWDAQGSGYYTLGEGVNEPLYYYARTSSGPAVGR